MGKGNSLIIKEIFCVVMLCGVSTAQALPVSTETTVAAESAAPSPLPNLAGDTQSSEPQPRYRLVSPALTSSSEDSHHLTEADFTWQAIAKNGPSSGSTPRIGESSGQSYFDFRDGLEHPYYILKLKKQ